MTCYTNRITITLNFTTNSRNCNLSSFESKTQSRSRVIISSKWNQVFSKPIEFSVNNNFSLFISQITNISQSSTHIITSSTNVSAIKVSSIKQTLAINIYKRIIICRIKFLFNPFTCNRQSITINTINLRCTTNRISILNFLILNLVSLSVQINHFF